jgi:hypothetical protein
MSPPKNYEPLPCPIASNPGERDHTPRKNGVLPLPSVAIAFHHGQALTNGVCRCANGCCRFRFRCACCSPPSRPAVRLYSRAALAPASCPQSVSDKVSQSGSLRAQLQYCGLRCNECGPGARARINDCGPGRGLYCEPSVPLVRAATPTDTPQRLASALPATLLHLVFV